MRIFLNHRLQKYLLTKHLVIGRTNGALQFPNDPNLSRVHCEIVVKNEKVFIKDLNSSNGTLVNGKRIGPSIFHILAQGDEIAVGNQTFVLIVEDYPNNHDHKCPKEIVAPLSTVKPLRIFLAGNSLWSLPYIFGLTGAIVMSAILLASIFYIFDVLRSNLVDLSNYEKGIFLSWAIGIVIISFSGTVVSFLTFHFYIDRKVDFGTDCLLLNSRFKRFSHKIMLQEIKDIKANFFQIFRNNFFVVIKLFFHNGKKVTFRFSQYPDYECFIARLEKLYQENSLLFPEITVKDKTVDLKRNRLLLGAILGLLLVCNIYNIYYATYSVQKNTPAQVSKNHSPNNALLTVTKQPTEALYTRFDNENIGQTCNQLDRKSCFELLRKEYLSMIKNENCKKVFSEINPLLETLKNIYPTSLQGLKNSLFSNEKKTLSINNEYKFNIFSSAQTVLYDLFLEIKSRPACSNDFVDYNRYVPLSSLLNFNLKVEKAATTIFAKIKDANDFPVIKNKMEEILARSKQFKELNFRDKIMICFACSFFCDCCNVK